MPDLEAALTGDVRGLRVGIPKEYRLDGTPAEITRLWQQGVDWLRAAGCTIREISLPHTKYALPAYYIVAPAEASSNLARYDGMRYGLRVDGADLIDIYARTRAAGFGKEVRRRVMIGTYVLSAGYYDAYYLKAQKVRTLIKRDFEQAFEQVDLVLTPATPTAGVPHRRQDGRPDRDVAERRVHGHRQPRRPAGDLGAGRAVGGRPAARAAADRPRRSTRRRCCARPTCWSGRRTSRRSRPTWPRGRRDERSAPQRQPDPGRDGRLGGRGRPRGARPGHLRGQAVLGRVHRVRRRAEHPRLADRRRHARHAAIGQPPLHRAGGADRPRAARKDQPVLGVRAQELLLSRSAERLSDLAVRRAPGRPRQARDRPARRHARRTSASPACTSRWTPARACTISAPTRRWSTSTARAWR